MFTGFLCKQMLFHTTLHTAIAVVITVLAAPRIPTVSAFAITVIHIGFNVGVTRPSHGLLGFHRRIVFQSIALLALVGLGHRTVSGAFVGIIALLALALGKIHIVFARCPSRRHGKQQCAHTQQ